MKRFAGLSVTIFVAVVFLGSGSVFAGGEGKYVYVDVAKVLEGYQKTKDNDTSLQTNAQKKQKDRDALVQTVRQLKDEVALLAEDARGKKQETLDAKIRELQDFESAAKRDLDAQRNKAVREIFKDIDDTIQRYGERKGYDFIFNERALLFRNAKYDMTADVLSELNKNYGKQKK